MHNSMKIPLDFTSSANLYPTDQQLQKEIEDCKAQGVKAVKRLQRLIRMELAKKEFKARIRKVKYLIADEISMISLQMLGYIEAKFRDLCESDKVFAGRSVLINVWGLTWYLVN